MPAVVSSVIQFMPFSTTFQAHHTLPIFLLFITLGESAAVTVKKIRHVTDAAAWKSKSSDLTLNLQSRNY